MHIKEIVILNFVLPLAERFVGTCATKWYRQICRMQAWSRSEVEDWQNKELQKFVQHAYHHTVYYHRLFDQLGIRPEEIRTIQDLKRLPTIDKNIVNAHHDELVPDNLATLKYRTGRTGGTTGEPMLYNCDEDVWGYVTAAKIFYWKKNNYHYGDAFVALGSSSLFSKKPSLLRRIYDQIRNEHGLNCVNLTDEICEQYVNYINAHHIHIIYGYAAAIYLFAKYIKSHNSKTPLVRAVFTTSENLTDSYRALIESTFHCKVMDCYGARDAGITAYEMAPQQYQIGYNALTEIIDEFAPNAGTVVSTNVLNYSFPLIRYRFGDEAELNPLCQSYNGQTFSKVLGRTSDILVLGNGHHLTATGLSMIMKEFDIVAFDIRKTGDDTVVLRVQPNLSYTQKQEMQIISTIKKYVGDDCDLKIEYVDHFEALPNGKHRYFYV